MTQPTPRLPPTYDWSAVRGNVTPRLWTPPLRPLTPETSYGFAAAEFARLIGLPFDPWQEWLVIHAGEMLPDGRPRFRHVLVLVSRQNGKTHMLVVLALFWQFVQRWELTLGTSTKLDYARESWNKAVKAAKRTRFLWNHVPARGGIRRTNGEQEMFASFYGGRLETRYKIGAATDDGGRSLSIDRLIQDELRQHHTYDAWNAGTGAMSARPFAQNYCLSNAGSDRSIVLNDRRDMALSLVKWWDEHGDDGVAELLLAGQIVPGMPNYRLGLFEWSAPLESSVTDMAALAQANPNLGHRGAGGVLRIDPQELYLEAVSALEKGGQTLTGFKTERMCIRVPAIDAAIDAERWKACAGSSNLAGKRVALVLDASPDLEHVTAVAAGMDGDTAVVDVVKAWSGASAVRDMQRDLPGLCDTVRPAVLGWFPGGPAAAAASTLRDRSKKDRFFVWPPAWLEVQEIAAETSGVCMAFAVDVRAGVIRHGDDPLLNEHALSAEKMTTGDTWRFARVSRDDEPDLAHCDAVYAAAGAAHLARTLPMPTGPIRLVSADDEP